MGVLIEKRCKIYTKVIIYYNNVLSNYNALIFGGKLNDRNKYEFW